MATKPVLKIRPVRIDEAEILNTLMAALYQEDPGHTTFSPEKGTRTLSFLLNNSDMGRVLFLMSNRTIIGYVILVSYWSNEFGGLLLFIDELFIKPDYRQQGYGTQFFTDLSRIQPAGCVGWYLEHTAQNSRAANLYDRLGFKPHQNTVLIKIF
ncbi:TPA: hypothetical protein DF272_04225 [Candidatus Falkowbacteria bacterium]|nr:hypothetical protein [Candidatus Falkowbacteria bacterium]